MDIPWHAQAKWIWHPIYDDSRNPGSIVLFRREFTVDEQSSSVIINVSADSRYRLFLNGQSISVGPCKGTPLHWYFETVDATSLLKPGRNVLAAQVLRYSPVHRGNTSVMRASVPGFILHISGEKFSLVTDEEWRCLEDVSIKFTGESTLDKFLSINESVYGPARQFGWDQLGFDDSGWPMAKQLLTEKPLEYTSILPWNLNKREIPPLTEASKRFKNVLNIRRSSSRQPEKVTAAWHSLLHGQQSLTIAPNDELEIDIEAPEHSTGYPSLSFARGKGTNVRLLFAESYETTSRDSVMPTIKSNRRDFRDGYLNGEWDTYFVAGRPLEIYDTFWFRTFRYVRLRIATSDEPLEILDFSYRQTNYPLEVKAEFRSITGTKYSQFWSISLRTLRNCMHETYEDCPYYEQSQFLFDTRIQILLTYIVSGDDRLARKAIHDFHTSLRPDGLMMMRYPAHTNIPLPGFSLFFPHLISDHIMHYGDKSLARRYFPTVDAVLNYFDRKVGADGLVGKFGSDQWSFVDWVSGWLRGVPDAARMGPGTYFNLAYAMALSASAQTADFICRPDTAAEYMRRRDAIIDAVNKHCFDGQWYYDGPLSNMTEPSQNWRSQHCQVIAILAGAVSGTEARDLMERTLEDTTLHQMSTSQAFYLFRALETTGLYHRCQELWLPWDTMIAQGLDTWAEELVNPRSDCHAWSATPLYELATAIVGVKPGAPGFAVACVKPLVELLDDVDCCVWTPTGMLRVQWTYSDSSADASKLSGAARTLRLSIDGPKEFQVNLDLGAIQGSKSIQFLGHYETQLQVDAIEVTPPIKSTISR